MIKSPYEGKIVSPYDEPGEEEPPVPRAQARPYDTLREETAKMGPLQRGIIGMGQGFMDVGRGAQQLYYDVTGQPQKSADIQRIGAEERAMVEPLGTAGKVGQFAGKTAPFLVVPGGVAGNALMRAGTAGLAGAGMGAMEFVPEGGSRGLNIATGAVGGAGMSGVASGMGKLINAPKTTVPTNKYGIPTTLNEATKGVSSRTDVLMERAPGWFGTKAFREKQHDAARGAAKRFVADYIADPASPTIEGNRTFIKGMYNEVKQLVGDVPQHITPTNTKKTAETLLDQFPDVFEKLQNTKLKKQIGDIVEGTAPTKASTILGPDGKPLTSANYRSFDDMWQLRQALGENLGFAKRELSKDNYSKYKQLWLAVSEDMDQWAGSIGRNDIMQKFRGANDAYKTYVVKHTTIQQAFDKTINEVGDKVMFSPQKFANNLKRIIEKDKTMKTFTPAEINEMAGLANIMQVVKRSGQYLENPPTGNRYGALTVGGAAEAAAYKAGGLWGAAKATTLAGSTALMTKFLTTTKAGQKFALAASKVEPNSPAMKAIVNSVVRGATKLGSTGAIQVVTPTPIEEEVLGVKQPDGLDSWLDSPYEGGRQ